MSVINEAIVTRNFEVVRDRIGEILADELPNQATLNSLTYLDATVWNERFIPFSYAEMPSVNVSVLDKTLDSYTQYEDDQTVVFNIDIHMSAKTVGSERGDVRSMHRLQRLSGVVYGILMHNRYKTLGFAPNTIVMNRHVEKLSIGQPEETNDATSVTMARITYAVRIADGTQTPEPVLIDGYQTQVQLEETDSGYLWGGGSGAVPPPVCDGVRFEINDTFIADLDSGITFNLPVLNTNSTEVGSMVGSEYIIEDTTLNVNGTLFDSYPSAEDIDFKILNDDDVEVGAKDGVVWRVPSATVDKISYYRPLFNGQKTSFANYDTGWRSQFTDYYDVIQENGKTQQLDFEATYPFATLKYKNIHGTYDRFMTIGGDQNWGDYSTFVDHLTGELYSRVSQASMTQSTAMNTAYGLTLDGETNFFVPDQNMIYLIMNLNSGDSGLHWGDVDGIGTHQLIVTNLTLKHWTSDRVPTSVSPPQGMAFYPNVKSVVTNRQVVNYNFNNSTGSLISIISKRYLTTPFDEII